MTTEEYLQWEQEAIERGYKKYNTTSSSNDYSYFKTIGKNDDGYKYMIEWRVWDWSKYIDRDPTLINRPYSLEVNIILSPNTPAFSHKISSAIELQSPPKPSSFNTFSKYGFGAAFTAKYS